MAKLSSLWVRFMPTFVAPATSTRTLAVTGIEAPVSPATKLAGAMLEPFLAHARPQLNTYHMRRTVPDFLPYYPGAVARAKHFAAIPKMERPRRGNARRWHKLCFRCVDPGSRRRYSH